MKRFIAAGLALSIIMTGLVYADDTAKNVKVDDVEIGESISHKGLSYIPVRAFADALGLEVEWVAESKTVVVTNGGPIYVTFKAGENGYTHARTAPIPMSGEPVIQDSLTYIPADAAAELFSLDIEEDETSVNFVTQSVPDVTESTEETTEAVTDEASEETTVGEAGETNSAEAEETDAGVEGVVAEVSDEEILFEDEELGQVRLNLGGDVVITDKDGSEIDASEIKAGDKLTVVYGEAMTMSIPPLNNPISITLSE